MNTTENYVKKPELNRTPNTYSPDKAAWRYGWYAYNEGDAWDPTKDEDWQAGYRCAHEEFMKHGKGYIPMNVGSYYYRESE